MLNNAERIKYTEKKAKENTHENEQQNKQHWIYVVRCVELAKNRTPNDKQYPFVIFK